MSVSPSVSGVAFLILSQVFTKAFTFASNQLLVRNISPQIFGIASYLEFVVDSVLFFAREAERNAIQRVTSDQASKTLQIITNFAYIPLLLGIPVSIVTFWLQKSSEIYAENIAVLPYSEITILLTVSLIFLELAAEPLFALNQYLLDFKIRSKIESLAVFLRCIVTLGGVLFGKRNFTDRNFDGIAVASFALGQFVYSATTASGFLILKSFQIPTVKKVQDKEHSFWLDLATFSLWKSLSVQMAFKHLLTEGDHIVVNYLFNVSEQGVYSVIQNYGSIVARLLFLPVEESLRMTFTKMFAEKTSDLSASYKLMEHLLVFYANLSLLLVLGGYTNGGYLLRILIGKSEKWKSSSVFDYFPQYVLYLPFLAFNGILEAFFSSACTQKQIGSFSAFMSVSSGAVLTLLYILVDKLLWGLTGIIVANIANMLLRIAYCSNFLVDFYRKNQVSTNLGSVAQRLVIPLLSATTTFVIQYQLFNGVQASTFKQFLQSISLCFLCLLVILYGERNTLRGPILNRIKRKGD